MSSAQIIALSGPSEGQVFPVDEDGIRLSEDCVVRLCDGRAVAYGRRGGQERPWCLLDHNARIDVGPSEFRLEHPEIDPARVVGMFPMVNLHETGRQDERIEITRIASYISIFLANAGTGPQENDGVPWNGDPPQFETVLEDPKPMYRFDHKKQRAVLEQVPSTLEGMLDSVVFGIFY